MNGIYNPLLVFLSYVIAVFGSFTALQLAGRIKYAESTRRWMLLISASVALGGGAVWSMHFIGMLAFSMPMAMSYDLPMTLLSLLVAVVVSGVGLYIVNQNKLSTAKLAAAGLFVGAGVSSMHYMGMEAMIMAATLSYDPALFAASVIIAIVAATVALWLSVNLSNGWLRLISAFVMGAAVAGMHYVGMAATTFTPTDAPLEPIVTSISIPMLAVSIAGATVVVLMTALIYLLYEELNGLARAR